MFFYVNIFISNEGGIAKKLLLFKIKFVVIYNLLIILIWETYQHILLIKTIWLIYTTNYTV